MTVTDMNGSGYVEFMATAQAESAARKKRQRSSLQMRGALEFAHTTKGRLLLRARSLLGSLGPFGAVILALYPVGLVAVLAVVAFTAKRSRPVSSRSAVPRPRKAGRGGSGEARDGEGEWLDRRRV